MLKLGDNAPLFELADQNGVTHALEDYRGRWVILYFYPKDNTPGCTLEACSFRDNWERLRKKAVIFGVSSDSTESHRKFAQKLNLPFPILSDTQKDTVKAYGVWKLKKFLGKEFLGIERTTFIIGPEGKLRKIYRPVKPVGHAAVIAADLNLLV